MKKDNSALTEAVPEKGTVSEAAAPGKDPGEICAILSGSPSDRPWEGCINSVTYRVPRGVPVQLPRFLYDHIIRSEAERREAEEAAERLSHAIRL